ncbi:hypothetical protein H4R20_000409 [Coemansia guatemalensis]|uniref:Uncharacterized protein n=1 Tax=Coemansia guatemalensis TaxID=2761395 RepID=A0A9W8LVV5_9FUNG|nr:hypothetical protein H4R20_000409 [Coemansia guatemalensis]
MNIDLLGDDSSDNEGQQNILRPTIRPQHPNTASEVAAQLAQLSFTSADTAAIGTGNNKSNNGDIGEEDDDFGEFLQSEAVSDGWESPEKQEDTAPDTSNIASEHINGVEVLPFSLPQPPPPASASRPRADVETKTSDKIRSRRGTIADVHTLLSGHQAPEATIADQLLSWISGTENSTLSDHTSVDHSEPMTDIARAWEHAEGLMGGSNPSTHIAEIAARLCNAALPNPQHEQTSNPLSSITIPLTDPIEASIDDLLSRKCAESTYRILPETSIVQQTYNLVWPLYSHTRPVDVDTDLTSAYLRIAEMLESSTDNASIDTAQPH